MNATPDTTLAAPVFRIVAPAIDVWSVAGSLSDSGRFNIGGAQQTPQLAHYTKFSVLYVASDLECCIAEVAKPMGKSKAYKLTPKKELILWDLNKVIEVLDHPTLKDLINSTPVDAIWGYQKIPLVSQILEAHLKAKGGNGILFPSVKKPSSNNIALFFASDADSKATFDIEEVTISN